MSKCAERNCRPPLCETRNQGDIATATVSTCSRRSPTPVWVFRYKVNGSKLREAGLGRAGEGSNCVRLSEAREKASVLFRQVKSGIDPLVARDAVRAASRAAEQDAAIRGVTFRDAARRYIDGHAPSWRNPKHAAQWSSTLDAYAMPRFGDLAVADVRTAHVLAALEPIWPTKPETASRLRGRIEKILDFAKARGWRSGENPAAWKGHLALTLPARSKVAKSSITLLFLGARLVILWPRFGSKPGLALRLYGLPS